jgi:hypothetical protein
VPFLSLIPAVASGVLFMLLWLGGLLSRPLVVGAWWGAGVCLQFILGGSIGIVSLAGLLMNVALGVYLSVRLKTA